jgi:hypothetical protein
MTSHANRTDTFPYPTGSVVGVVTDSTALEDARRRLEAGGFDLDRCDVLHGEEGLSRIDVDGAAHGRSGSLMRRLQGALSDDAAHVRRYAEHLREGHYVLAVRVGEDEAAKERVADALRGSHAEFVHYYAENYVEDLGS